MDVLTFDNIYIVALLQEYFLGQIPQLEIEFIPQPGCADADGQTQSIFREIRLRLKRGPGIEILHNIYHYVRLVLYN